MSDSPVFCPVCGDESDFHHVFDGGYPQWQAVLFRAGKGCDVCEGVRPANFCPDVVARRMMFQDIDDGDVMPRIDALGAPDDVDFSQHWVKPPDVVLATCDGCDYQAKIDPDDVYSGGGKKGHIVLWHKDSSAISSLGRREDVDLEEFLEGKRDLMEIDDTFDFDMNWCGKTLCAECRTRCDNCDAELFDRKALEKFCSDTYDTGNSFFDQNDMKTRCIECVEAQRYCRICETTCKDDELNEDDRCEGCRTPAVVHLTDKDGDPLCNEITDVDDLSDDLDDITCKACLRMHEIAMVEPDEAGATSLPIIHLFVAIGPGVAACGARTGNVSQDVADVTCADCQARVVVGKEE